MGEGLPAQFPVPVPLLPFWATVYTQEKGLGDEGKRFVSQLESTHCLSDVKVILCQNWHVEATDKVL